MGSIVISIIVFIVTAVTHIFWHRFLVTQKIYTVKSGLIFGIGFISLVYFFFFNDALPQLPYSGIIIYTLLSGLYMMFFASLYTGDTSPSLKLLLLIKKTPGLTQKEILNQFSDIELIDNRLQKLILDGLVKRTGNHLTALPKGQRLIAIIDAYRTILHWKSSG